jgi:hypothetical protein
VLIDTEDPTNAIQIGADLNTK